MKFFVLSLFMTAIFSGIAFSGIDLYTKRIQQAINGCTAVEANRIDVEWIRVGATCTLSPFLIEVPAP
jgi:hypothetical protein